MKKEELISRVDKNKLPRHIAIIMDGNGRWAKKKKLPKIMGHRQGVKAVRKTIKACGEIGVEVLTLYTFSTENWKRSSGEVSALMSLLSGTVKKEARKLKDNNVKLIISGDIEKLKPALQKLLKETMTITRDSTGLVLNIALNYGGRQEIVRACKRIVRDVRDKKIKAGNIDEGLFSDYLFTAGLPDPELLIRTSGELRISNFLLYQIAYSEIYVTKVLWPDFNEKHLVEAIVDFQNRERRFGSSL